MENRRSMFVFLLLFHIIISVTLFSVANTEYLSSLHNGEGFWNFARDSTLYHKETLNLITYLEKSAWLDWWHLYPGHKHVKLASLIYWITGYHSLITFEIVNCVVWATSLLLIYRASELLFPGDIKLPLIVSIFFLQPSVLISSTQLLREPIFILGFSFICYGFSIFAKQNSKWKWVFVIQIGIILMLLMRDYVSIILLVFLFLFSVIVYSKNKAFLAPLLVLLIPLILFEFFTLNSYFLPTLDAEEKVKREVKIYDDANCVESVRRDCKREVLQFQMLQSATIEEQPQVSIAIEDQPQVSVAIEEQPQVSVAIEEQPQVSVAIEEQPQVSVAIEEEPRSFLIRQEKIKSDTIAIQEKIKSDTIAIQEKIKSDTIAFQKQAKAGPIAIQEKIKSDTIAIQGKITSDTIAIQGKIKSDTIAIQKQAQALTIAIQKQAQARTIAVTFQTQADITNQVTILEILNAISRKMNSIRYAFIFWHGDNAGSSIDIERQYSNFSELVLYFPRALQIGLLSPFPSDWLKRGVEVGLIGNLLAAMEMTIWYVILLGFIYIMYKNPSVMKPLYPILLFSITLIILLGYIVPNIGAIYRMRQAYMIPFFLFGAYGLRLMISNYNKKQLT